MQTINLLKEEEPTERKPIYPKDMDLLIVSCGIALGFIILMLCKVSAISAPATNIDPVIFFNSMATGSQVVMFGGFLAGISKILDLLIKNFFEQRMGIKPTGQTELSTLVCIGLSGGCLFYVGYDAFFRGTYHQLIALVLAYFVVGGVTLAISSKFAPYAKTFFKKKEW